MMQSVALLTVCIAAVRLLLLSLFFNDKYRIPPPAVTECYFLVSLFCQIKSDNFAIYLDMSGKVYLLSRTPGYPLCITNYLNLDE